MPNKVYSGLGFGLDLVNNPLDQERNPLRSLDNLNIISRTGGGFEKRKGYQAKVDLTGEGGYGLFNYTFRNTDGTVSEEILSIGKSLYRIKTGTINLTNDGSSTGRVTILQNATDIQLIVYEDDSVTSTQNLGKGFDEASPTSMSSLSSTLDGLANFSSTVTGDSTVSAAFLDISNEVIIPPGLTRTLPFSYSEKVNEVITSPLKTYVATQENDNFRNVSGTTHKNVFYFAYGESLMKYDGQTFYKAGLPKPALGVASLNGAGVLTGAYTYSTTYVYTDNRLNSVESEMGTDISISPSSNQVDLTLRNLEASSGYSTNCAIASSNQTVAPSSGTVTLNVSDGTGSPHTLKAGDTAYLYNRSTSAYATYAVSSVTSTTIVLTSSETIGVNLNDVISNNLRIAIYRTEAGGTNKALIEEIPNNSFQSSQVYSDSTLDSSLGAEFTIPLRAANNPPTCSYVTSYKDNLILGEGFTLYYSDEGNVFSSSEVFPSSDNSLTIFSKKGGILSGLGVSGDTLTLFTDTSLWGIQGDLISDNFLVFKISDHIGCVSSDSIQNVGESLYFLSSQGVFAVNNGRLSNISGNSTPISESFAINSIFENKHNYTLSRSVGLNDARNSRYLLFLPVEKTDNDQYATKDSRVLVYEYDLNNWFIWSGINMYGGGVISGGNFFFSSRDKTLQENRILSKQLRDDRPSDYWDHLGVISSKYVSGWDPVLPDFSTPFKPLYLKVFSYRSEDSDFEMNFTVDAKIERDFNPGVNLFSENLAFDDFGPPWGFPWNSKWGSYQESFSRKKIKGSKTRNLRFTFSNSEGGQNCVISAWELSFSTPFGSSMNSSSNDLFIR